MSVRDVRKKLRAWDAGHPVPRYDTIHHAVVPEAQALILVFLRMAGESRPWAIAWGTADSEPRMLSVPDGRVRDDVAEMCAEMAEDLLDHLRVHNWTYDPVDQKASPEELRQVWLPNGQHLAMLHQLTYTYSQTKYGGANQEILRALGRIAGWMFRDSSRRGCQHVVSASAALNDAYVFPAQDARTAHLGYQLAWLQTEGSRDEHLAAAAAAERLTVSPTLDPAVERDSLSGLVDTWQAARRDEISDEESAASIAVTLHSELERRFRLAQNAYWLLADNERPVNTGVGPLIKEAHQEFWFQHQRIELRTNDPNQGPAFIAHPETDYHGSSAASRYLVYAAADEAYLGHLIHGDAELFEEALEAGKAFTGTVATVSDAGTGKGTQPQWVVHLDPTKPHRLRENGRLTPYGSRGHEATIVSLDSTVDALEVRLEWTARKTMALGCGIGAKPIDTTWAGQHVSFVVSDAADLTKRRGQRVWKAKDGPGAWLTHGRPPAQVEITDDDGATDVIVDDVAQIEAGVTP